MNWTRTYTLSALAALFILQALTLFWGPGAPSPRLDVLARALSAVGETSARAPQTVSGSIESALTRLTQVKIERRRTDEAKRRGGLSLQSLFSAETPDIGIVTLRRVADEWRVQSASLYPAALDKVEGTLRAVLGIQLDVIAASSSAHHKRLRVSASNFDRRLTLKTSERSITVYLGFGTVRGATHVRFAGEERVYLAHNFTLWRDLLTELEDLINLEYVGLDAPRVIEVRGPGTRALTLKLTGAGDEAAWRVEGLTADELDPARARSFVNAARSLMIRTVMGPYQGERSIRDYQLDRGVHVTVRNESGSISYRVSSVAPPTTSPEPAHPHASPKRRRVAPPRYYSHSEGHAFVVEVAESKVRALLTQRLIDFSRVSARGDAYDPPTQAPVPHTPKRVTAPAIEPASTLTPDSRGD